MAAALVTWMRRRSTLAPSPLAAAGVSVIGLFVLGVAALLLGAVGVTVALTLAGVLVGAPLGGRRAAAIGLF